MVADTTTVPVHPATKHQPIQLLPQLSSSLHNTHSMATTTTTNSNNTGGGKVRVKPLATSGSSIATAVASATSTCGGCGELFTREGPHQPRVLDCLHPLCMSCIGSRMPAITSPSRSDQPTSPSSLSSSSSSSSSSLSSSCSSMIWKGCPLCSTRISSKALNNTHNQLVAQLEAADVTSGATSAQCGQCDDDERDPAVSHCTQCNQFLCAAHDIAHRKGKATKTHNRIPIDELYNTSSSTLLPSLIAASRPRDMCVKHPNQELAFYCDSDRSVICRDCAVLDHRGHTCLSLSEAFDKYRVGVANALV
jgi:hypothetical protein